MTDSIKPLLTVSNLSVRYGRKTAVKNVSFQAGSGEFTAIIGANGSGKTSLIKAILNLVPHTGSCFLSSCPIEAMPVRTRAKQISYLPQKSGIGTSMTVQEVCLLGFHPALRLLESPNAVMKARAERALTSVGLQDMSDRDFLTLSEGQKQLCLLARTLVEDTLLLLLDEPDSSLDFTNRHMLMRQIRSMLSEQKSILMCIHSPELALRYCDRILLMKDGELVASLETSAATLAELNEKLSLIYDSIQVVECADRGGAVHRIIVSP
ncbi:MAG: ABC transporter ATP-binding protein [Lachnospiraceae bacterium]|nr:ABC transporter ATP-binding protein [Lachnospiraceae bacterium]